MSYSRNDLRREVEGVMKADLEAGRVVIRGWVVHTILSRHELPVMPDRDFNVLCRMEHVTETVREILREWKKSDEDAEAVADAGTLPGFRRLRLGYPLERESKLVIVPIQRMSAAELKAKTAKYRALGDGCYEHADEMERYCAMMFPDADAA